MIIQLVKRYPLLTFFLLAYAFSWIVWTTMIAVAAAFQLRYDTYGWPMLWLTGMWGPSFSALVITGIGSGKTDVRSLLSRLLHWRVSLQWFLFALLVIPASKMLVFFITWLSGSTLLENSRWLALASLIPIFLIFFAYGAPLQEELGWRGYALPRLQQHWGALLGMLILALLWIGWHFPLFWIPGGPYDIANQPFIPFLVNFLAYMLPSTFLFTWLYNNAKGSVLLCMILHAANNTSGSIASLLGVTNYAQFNLINIIVLWLLAIGLVLATKGRLSWNKGQKMAQRDWKQTLDTQTQA